MNNFRLIFSIYFIVFAIVIVSLSSFISYKINLINILESIENSANEIARVKKFDYLKPNIETFNQFLNTISSILETEAYLTNPTEFNQRTLVKLFYAVMTSNNLIKKVSYLNEEGVAKFCIYRNNMYENPSIVEGFISVTEREKSYFGTINQLKNNDLWYSKLGLHEENNIIQLPHQPILTIGKSVFEENTFRGVLLVEILAHEMMNGLKNSTGFDHYLVDKDGYFLVHPNSNYSWSRYTDSNITIANEFSFEAEIIRSGKLRENKIFSFALSDILQNSDEVFLIMKPKNLYQESLVSTNIKTSLIMIFFSILLSLPLSFLASIIPHKLHKSLVYSNKELKRFSDIIDKYVITATTTPKGIIASISSAFSNISQYSSEELIGKPMSIIRHSETPKSIFSNLWRTIKSDKEWNGELKNHRKDGSFYYLNQTIFPLKNEKNEIISYMSIGVDITAKKEIEQLAEIDQLTNIYNKRKINMFLENEISRSNRYKTSLSLIVLDIDFFKKINDTYGHSIGDLTLESLSEILRNNIRKNDILGRFGGEEFIIITPETHLNSAEIFAEKLRTLIEKHHFPQIKNLTVSIGLSQYIDGETKENFFNRVDKALYIAKGKGRNNVSIC